MNIGSQEPKATGVNSEGKIPVSFIVDGIWIILIWLGALLLVRPVGDFPLNDDWSFARTVKNLLESGTFRPIGWTGMPLITQTLWGALFCLPSGFSFNALRLSTLVMSFCGIIATYLCVRQVHPSRLLAVVTSLTVAFNPIYFALSNTFMTDVTFTALEIMAALFFFGHLRGGSVAKLILGTLCALAATLCRQPGLAVPMAFAVCFLLIHKVNLRSIFRAVLPLAVCLASLIIYQHWLKATGRLPALYFTRTDSLFSTVRHPATLLASLFKHFSIAALYLGWFSIPVLVLFLPAFRNRACGSRTFIIASAAGLIFLLASLVGLLSIGRMMPTTGNILVAQGIGPLTLRDAYFTDQPAVASLGKTFWFSITGISILGGSILVSILISAIFSWWTAIRTSACERPENLFFLLCCTIYLLPIVSLGGWDRYYLPGLPLLLVWIATIAPLPGIPGSRLMLWVSTTAVTLLAFFAMCTTRDYLTWNRTRWNALTDLTASGKISAEDIDGGFEFNGWFLYDPTYKEQPSKSWWWIRRDDYVIAFSEAPGYTTVKQYDFTRWLPPGKGRILVLRRRNTQDTQ